jgi:hypothetical protein
MQLAHQPCMKTCVTNRLSKLYGNDVLRQQFILYPIFLKKQKDARDVWILEQIHVSLNLQMLIRRTKHELIKKLIIQLVANSQDKPIKPS